MKNNLKQFIYEKKIRNYGGVIVFYALIIFAIFIINARFNYLNEINNSNIAYSNINN